MLEKITAPSRIPTTNKTTRVTIPAAGLSSFSGISRGESQAERCLAHARVSVQTIWFPPFCFAWYRALSAFLYRVSISDVSPGCSRANPMDIVITPDGFGLWVMFRAWSCWRIFSAADVASSACATRATAANSSPPSRKARSSRRLKIAFRVNSKTNRRWGLAPTDQFLYCI